MFFCFEGEAGSDRASRMYWNDTVERFLARCEVKDRGPYRARLWETGRTAGHERARDNDIRKIDTGDVGEWGRRLLDEDPQVAISAVEIVEVLIARKMGAD